MVEKEINFYFRKERNGWASNFWRAEQVIGNKIYGTNEHYYQSEKTEDVKIKDWIRFAPNPFLAMKAGRVLRKNKELVEDWELKKKLVMLVGLRAKFSQNVWLRAMLLDTGDATIHEDSPTDMYWGKKGKDMLGKLLMQVREELKNE